MSDNTNQNVEIVSSLVDEILEDMYNIEARASYIGGDFGNAFNEKVKGYSTAASELSEFTVNSFKPASQLIEEYKQGIDREKLFENKINMEVELKKRNIYQQIYDETKNDLTAREASEKAAMDFKRQKLLELDNISRENNDIRLKIENYGEESLITSPAVIPYRLNPIEDEIDYMESDVIDNMEAIQTKYGVVCVNNQETIADAYYINDVQTKYGVVCVNPPAPEMIYDNIQTKYGVVCPPAPTKIPDGVQTKYGVAPPAPALIHENVQTKYGVACPTGQATLIDNVQTKYGVVCSPGPTKIPSGVQTKYGVAPPAPQTTTVAINVPDGNGGTHLVHQTINLVDGVQTRYGVVGPCGLPFNVQTRYGIKECK